LSAILAAATLHSRRRRTQYCNWAGLVYRGSSHTLQKLNCRCPSGGLRSPDDEMSERRPACLLAFLERELSKRCVIVLNQATQERVCGVVCLDQDLPRLFSSSCSSGHLQQSLSEPFAAAEIRAEQALIGAQNSDQGHPREVVPLGQHLGSNQDLSIAVLYVGEHVGERSFTTGAISIEPCDSSGREQCR
jgi:hypothetical protein